MRDHLVDGENRWLWEACSRTVMVSLIGSRAHYSPKRISSVLATLTIVPANVSVHATSEGGHAFCAHALWPIITIQ